MVGLWRSVCPHIANSDDTTYKKHEWKQDEGDHEGYSQNPAPDVQIGQSRTVALLHERFLRL